MVGVVVLVVGVVVLVVGVVVLVVGVVVLVVGVVVLGVVVLVVLVVGVVVLVVGVVVLVVGVVVLVVGVVVLVVGVVVLVVEVVAVSADAWTEADALELWVIETTMVSAAHTTAAATRRAVGPPLTGVSLRRSGRGLEDAFSSSNGAPVASGTTGVPARSRDGPWAGGSYLSLRLSVHHSGRIPVQHAIVSQRASDYHGDACSRPRIMATSPVGTYLASAVPSRRTTIRI